MYPIKRRGGFGQIQTASPESNPFRWAHFPIWFIGGHRGNPNPNTRRTDIYVCLYVINTCYFGGHFFLSVIDGHLVRLQVSFTLAFKDISSLLLKWSARHLSLKRREKLEVPQLFPPVSFPSSPPVHWTDSTRDFLKYYRSLGITSSDCVRFFYRHATVSPRQSFFYPHGAQGAICGLWT